MPCLNRYWSWSFLCFFNHSLREKCPHTSFFCSILSGIWIKYEKIWSQKTSVFRHFSSLIESKQTEKLLSLSMKNMTVYSVETQDMNNEFSFKIEIKKLEVGVLTGLPNPNYKIIMNICEI